MSDSTQRAELRKQLLANGYRPLPLLDKGIRIKGWSTATIDEDWLDQFARSGKYQNTGIRCDDLIAFDIDVYDEDLANDIEDLIERYCGPTEYCRVGQWPKRLLLYRLDGEPIRSARTGKFDGHQVELLASSGRQFAAFGIHPGTGKPYEWEGWNPENHAIRKVPLLEGSIAQGTLDQIEQLFIDKGLERTTEGNTIGSTGRVEYDLTDETMFQLENGVDMTWQALKQTLTEKGIWCNIMRENGQFGDSEGVHAFLAKGSGQPTVHDFPRDTTRQEAMQAVQLPDPPSTGQFSDRTVLDDMLDKWVLFNEQGMRRVNHPLREYPVNGMKLRMKAITIERTDRNGVVKHIPVMDLWLANPRKLSADFAQLRPDHPSTVLIDQGEETVFNTYRAPIHTDTGGDIETFIDFITHLIPSESECDLFLDWLALKIKHPSWRMHGFLMVTPTYGTGRGTLFQIVEKLFGIQYVKSMEYDDLIGHTSQSTYNDYFADSLIVTVEEVLEKEQRVSDWEARKIAYERLKTICEPVARPMHIKRKYGRNSTEMVFASLLVSSNHPDALAIEPGDRRLIVIDNTEVKLINADNDLYDRIEAWQEVPANIGVLYKALIGRADRAQYEPFKDPPFTPAKQRMIDAGQSDLDQLFELFVAECEGDICVHYQWEMFVRRKALEGQFDLPSGDNLTRGITKVIAKRACRFDAIGGGQMSINNHPDRPWIINNRDKWKHNTNRDEWRAEIDKNGPTKADVSQLIPK